MAQPAMASPASTFCIKQRNSDSLHVLVNAVTSVAIVDMIQATKPKRKVTKHALCHGLEGGLALPTASFLRAARK